MSSTQGRLTRAGAILIAASFFTGIWTAVALTGQVVVPNPRLALIAHLNALIGGLWIFAVAYSMNFLNYQEKQLKLLSRLVCIAAYGNWLITLLASLWGVTGLQYNSDPRNNFIAALLQIFVVLPSLVASVYWVLGFRRRAF